MGHVTSKPAWGTIDIDTSAGNILVREDWQYTWKLLGAGIAAWTYQERKRFHQKLDREIWGRWSSHFPIKVKGASPFAQRFASSQLTLNYDIRWVLHNGQWQVTVFKVAPNTDPNVARAFVVPTAQTVTLYSTIFRSYTAGNAANAARKGFLAGPHEFGHTMENPDEYLAASAYLQDADSIMNIGKQVRERHLHVVIAQLNTMIPGTTFHV
jgi:hypothetical protein